MMIQPQEYIATLFDIGQQRPKFYLGQEVVDREGRRGLVHVIYANLYSAINSLTVPEDWWERQTPRPKTAKAGFWYAVLLTTEYGDLLVGEDDMGAVQ